MAAPSEFSVVDLNTSFADQTPQAVLAWVFKTFGRRAALCCGFGVEGVAILDMLMKIEPAARVFTLDTGRLAPQTYELIDKCARRYGTRLEVFFPSADEVEKMVAAHGINLFYNSVEQRQTCCEVRKIHPLRRALSGMSVWITGLRKEQSSERQVVEMLEIDTEHGGILKVNPLAHWSEAQVWSYVRDHGVPYNSLYDAGYTSIGCLPCTRASRPGEDPRAGRWWWEQDQPKECGIHNFRRNGTRQLAIGDGQDPVPTEAPTNGRK